MKPTITNKKKVSVRICYIDWDATKVGSVYLKLNKSDFRYFLRVFDSIRWLFWSATSLRATVSKLVRIRKLHSLLKCYQTNQLNFQLRMNPFCSHRTNDCDPFIHHARLQFNLNSISLCFACQTIRRTINEWKIHQHTDSEREH